MKALTKKQKTDQVKKLPGWTLQKNDTVLKRSMALSSYIDGVVLIAKIAVHAEVLDHHPELSLKKDTLDITITTKSVQNLTLQDIALAHSVDKLSA